MLLYFAEGLVRGFADSGVSSRLAVLEALLALVFFVSAIGYVRPARSAA